MVRLIKLIGILIFFAGAVYLTKPSLMKKVLRFWMKEGRIQLGGLLNILVGITFILNAAKCQIPGIIILVGILSLIKGIFIFTLGTKKILFLAETMLKKPLKTLRGFALIALGVGVLVIYAA